VRALKPKNKIKEFRDKRGLTQVELGQLLGMSQTAISLYESGDRKPDVETAKNIAKVLHTTLDSIFAP
jgi:DNA-binding XRE family transcriptional regulator